MNARKLMVTAAVLLSASFFRLGVDGVFSDFGDTAVRAKRQMWP